jgi:hypothetical protein
VISTEPASEHAPFFRVTIERTSRPLWFTVDTGSPYTFLDKRVAAELGLPVTGAGTIGGAGAGRIDIQLVKNVTFRIGGVASPNYDVRVADLSGLPALFDHPIDGFFGYDFMIRDVVTFDPDHNTMTLGGDARIKGVALPIRFGGKHGRWIYIPGTVKIAGNPAETSDLLVDFGSTDALNHPLLRKSTAPLRQIQTGNGLGTPIPGVVGEAEWLRLGDYTLHNVHASCCGASPGTERMIGQAVLSRFVISFDYARKRMILRPAKRFTE